MIISDFHPEAIRVGWKRTFQCGSETMEVESFPYSIEGLVETAAGSGLPSRSTSGGKLRSSGRSRYFSLRDEATFSLV